MLHIGRQCPKPGRTQPCAGSPLVPSLWHIREDATSQAHAPRRRRRGVHARPSVVALSGWSPLADYVPPSKDDNNNNNGNNGNGSASSWGQGNGNGYSYSNESTASTSSGSSYWDQQQQEEDVDESLLSWEDQIALEEKRGREREEARKREEEEKRVKKYSKRFRSSWNAVEAGGGRGGGADYLYEIGAAANQNTRVDLGQNLNMIDSHFTGNFLGHKSDIADGSLRKYEFRSFNNLVGDYYVAPSFLEKVAMHVVKNYMVEFGCIDPKCKVPLILGVWGEKGMGKTFQTELALKKLGAEAVVMSAGELEHEWAGTPGRLIRERYKKAGELSKVRGKFSVLMINDVDAGLGHFENTQVTVNNQIVIGTLMNLCDNPNKVSVGEDWAENDVVRRTPIIVTGNDFSKMFAPLIRDGRMDKFYWKPTTDDLVNILFTLYADDGLSEDDMVALLKRFPNQPLDFFGALRASTYDSQIREWIERDVLGRRITAEDANMSALSQRLATKTNLPTFSAVELTLADLVREGERLEREQEMVNQHKLSVEYLKPQRKIGRSMLGLKG